MKDKAYRKIAEKIIRQSCHGEKGSSFRLESLFKEEGYLKKNGRTNLDSEWIRKVDAAAGRFCDTYGLTGSYDDETGTCRALVYTKEQAQEVCRREGSFPVCDYRDRVLPVLERYRSSSCSCVSRYAGEREKEFPWTDLYKTSPSEAARETELLLCACEKASALFSDILIRNASKEWFGDSKELEKHYLKKMLKVFFPEEKIESAVRESFFLQRLHLLKNPWYQPVKGEGTIWFDDGSFLVLKGYVDDTVCFSDSMVRRITRVECERLFIIENLTTFTDYPFDIKGLVIYSGGFAKTATIRFITKTEKETQILHCGDIDAYGFAIIQDEEEKTGRKICPCRMDLQTYALNAGYLTGLSESNIKLLQKMEKDDRWDKETRSLFRKMLTEKKGLEQESLSLQVGETTKR